MYSGQGAPLDQSLASDKHLLAYGFEKTVPNSRRRSFKLFERYPCMITSKAFRIGPRLCVLFPKSECYTGLMAFNTA